MYSECLPGGHLLWQPESLLYVRLDLEGVFLLLRDETLFNSLKAIDHVWSTDLLPWYVTIYRSASISFQFFNRWLTDFCLLSAKDDIRKTLYLNVDMAKVRQAMNIPARFCEWHWLLSEYQIKAGGLPPQLETLRGGSCTVLIRRICLTNRTSPRPNSLKKGKLLPSLPKMML